MTLEDQLRAWDHFAARAYELALDNFAEQHKRIMALARARFVEGYGTYGAEMFDTPIADLRLAELEENADAVNYKVAQMAAVQRHELAARSDDLLDDAGLRVDGDDAPFHAAEDTEPEPRNQPDPERDEGQQQVEDMTGFLPFGDHGLVGAT